MMDMRLGILFVFILHLQIIVTAIYDGCAKCKCCVDEVCATAYVQNEFKADICTNGCIPGIGGNKCYNKCPDDCVTCEQTYSSNCATCEVGKYLSTMKRCVVCPDTCAECQTTCLVCTEQYYNDGQITDCSLKCPSNCKKCTSSGNCQECFEPFYNQGDINDCSLSCPENCVCSSPGVCSACQDGYFNENEQCNSACLDKCRTCSDLNSCLVCKDRYYNGKESLTNSEITDCSLQCRDTCVTCTAYDACSYCDPGHYGSYCQNKCSVGCSNSVCDQNDGSCVCKDGFKGSNCTTCVAGKHGDQCEKQCPDTCKNKTCRRETGYCSQCKSVNITGDICDRCVYGLWGTDCSSACPQNCNGQCERNSGHCELCKGNFHGDKCDDCISGFHGLVCDEKCPKQCYDSYCYRFNGTCKRCNDNYAGPTCEACVAGMYGENCDVSCLSIHCSGNTCDMYTGNCSSCLNGLYGLQCDLHCSSGCNDASCDFGSGACSMCTEHYTGDKCCLEDGHCRYCSSNTVCETCDIGFFGEKCDKTCPITCTIDGLELHCEKAYGKCLSCTDGVHGDYCNKTCNDRCSNIRCDKDNGHCLEGCAGDFEGPTCKQDKIIQKTKIAPVVGGGAAGFVVIIVILLIVVIRRRRSHANRREDYIEGKQKDSPQLPGPSPKRIDNKPIYSNDELESAELEEEIIEDDIENIVIIIPVGREAVYENVTNATVSGLESYVRKKTEEDYKQEFAV